MFRPFSAKELREMGDPVLRLKEAIDWELFRPLLEKLVAITPKRAWRAEA